MTNENTLPCGLIGEKLGHSYSVNIHAKLGDYEYKLWEMPENEVGDFVRNGKYHAINVTIPYKKTVMPYLDEISDEAQRIGAVNTITRTPEGKLRGDNTDYYGFTKMLDAQWLYMDKKHVLIIGAGGASATAQAVARDSKAASITVLSSKDNTPEKLATLGDTQILVNCSPVGMYPNGGVSPVQLDYFPKLEGVLDMVYNPADTRLLQDARERRIPCVGGLVMLVAQAKRASELFFGQTISKKVIPIITKEIDKESRNLMLIGMPGSGKSTLGKALAEKLGRPFYDTDDMVVERVGMSIPEIFEKYGEKFFRQVERDCLIKLSVERGLVIATGGGAPVQPGIGDIIKQNSRLLYLRRPTEDLPTEGRPLSQKGDLVAMEKKRHPIYLRLCDMEITVDKDFDVTMSRALEVWKQ